MRALGARRRRPALPGAKPLSSGPPIAIHRVVARATSFVYIGLAVAMGFCAVLGFLFEHSTRPVREVDHGSVGAMLLSAGLVGGVGSICWWWGHPAQGVSFSRREAVFAVNAIWFGAAFLGGIPYVVDAGLPIWDGIFEAASGFTTTGATILADIEGTMSHTLLLWRSLSQWLGGMGIVVLFVAIFPSLGVGGKHMYRSEVPGHSAEGLQPRIAETSIALWRFYLAFTVLEVVILWWLGMDLFEAVNHAWTTMATGGFSTRNASIAGFESPAIEWVIAGFMLIAGVNFGLYYLVLATGRLRTALKSLELRVYLGLALVSSLVLTPLIVGVHGGDWLKAFRVSVFTIATTITSTGYWVDDYMAYPTVGLLVLLALMHVGGMSGSTAGGLKVSRLVILAETAWTALRRSVRPQVVQVVRLDGKVLDNDLLLDVSTFFFLFMACMSGGTFFVAMTDGVSVPTAFGAMLTSLSNMGPAPYYEGADNFAAYSVPAKLMFSVAMIIGRLEFLTVLVLLLPELWRR